MGERKSYIGWFEYGFLSGNKFIASLVGYRNTTSTIQGHNSQHHVLVKRILSVQFLNSWYDSICINGELSFPQVIDEGVSDLAKQPGVLICCTNLEVHTEIQKIMSDWSLQGGNTNEWVVRRHAYLNDLWPWRGIFLDFSQVEPLAEHWAVQIGSQDTYNHLKITIIILIVIPRSSESCLLTFCWCHHNNHPWLICQTRSHQHGM